MRWFVVIVVVLAWSTGDARADDSRYHYGVGFGPASLTGDLADHFSSDGQVSGRIYAGRRVGDWAVDAVFFGTDLALTGRPGEGTHSTLGLGVDVRRFVELFPHLEAYVRGGVDYTWLVRCHSDAPPAGYSGSGYHYGAGLEVSWRWRLPRRSGKPRMDLGLQLFADAGRQRTRLAKSGQKTLAGQIDQLTFGFGFSFAH